MNHQQLNCSQHPNEKFQYLCFKEQCISQKPTQCQLFFCILCYEELDENEQLSEHKLHHISVLNKVSKKSIFKNKQIIGDKLWQLIKEKNNGSLLNFENECLQINQKFDQIKNKYHDHINTIRVHFQNLKFEINEQLDQINKNINVKMNECRNLQKPILITKLAEKKTQDFQEFLNELQEKPKDSLKYYKSAFQDQLKNLRKNTKSLMIATEFSKKIKELKQEQQDVYFQLSDLNKIQEQNQNEGELNFDEKHIRLLKFNEINYSQEISTQINNKIQEFKVYMSSLLEVCQIQSQPFEQVLQDNFEIKQQFQQIIKQMQQNNQYDNDLCQEIDYINKQKQIIHQYTDSVKFLEDFPDINNQQQYKKLTKSQINAITDLRVQIGYCYDLKNKIELYGYNSSGKQGIKEINEIIFNNQELKNLQNLSLNYFNSKLSIQEYLQMISQLGNWQLTPQIKKLSLGYQFNNLNLQKVSQIIQQLFRTQKLENLQELELLFNQNYFSNLKLFPIQLINRQKKLENQYLTQQDENLNKQQTFQIRQEQLKDFNFYLYNLEKLKINLSFCNINDEKLSKISEQVALLGVCMPKLSFLEIQLAVNKKITNEGIKTFFQSLANSSLLKNLKEISLNFNDIENISDDSLIQFSEILVSKGQNLNAVYLYMQTTNVSSLAVKRISEILSNKQLKKLLLDFCFNDQLNGQEIIDVAQAITQTKISRINQTFFHQNLNELSIRFNKNPSEQQMLEFFDIITNNQYFPSLSSLQMYAYNNKLNDDNFQTIWNQLTNPESLTNLKYLNLCLAGENISPENQVLASLKIAQTSKFQNLEELLLYYSNSSLNKQDNNKCCAVSIVQNLVNSENLKKLKHLSLNFQNNDLTAEECKQIVEELSKPKNKLSLEEISLSFQNNGVEKNQCQELNRQFRDSLITEQLRVANIYFGIV